MSKKNKQSTNSLKIPKLIVLSATFLDAISTKLATRFAAKIFTTPLKHAMPNREKAMDTHSIQSIIRISSIKKEIVVYQYGVGIKKVLFVHGWSGRGTQMFKIADAFLSEGYQVISFDAPSHGKSPGNTTIMVEFIAAILAMDKEFGPFEAAVGHSLGGMALMNALNSGFQVKKLVTIGSGDKVADIATDFILKIGLKVKHVALLISFFEKKYSKSMDALSSFQNAQKIEIPVLVIHDINDKEVPISCGNNIVKHLKNGTLLTTTGLGHRKILGDSNVADSVVEFVI